MKGFSIMLATVLFAGSMAFAQVCPPTTGSVCLVPPSNVTTTLVNPSASVFSTGTVVASAACPSYYTPTASNVCPQILTPVAGTTCTTVSALPQCSLSSLSPETACIVNEVRAVRGDMYAMGLTQQGMALVNQMNMVMSEEQAFRQAIAANPDLPNAQATAAKIQSDLNNLNRSITAFNQQLTLVPVTLQPYAASQFNTFATIYWVPARQQFAAYQASFPQAITTYQTAFNENPWLQGWVTNYQTALNTTVTNQQVIASAQWWITPQVQVLGSTEFYQPGNLPAGSSIMVLPSGSVLYFPPGSTIPQTGTISTVTMGTMGNPAGMTGGVTTY